MQTEIKQRPILFSTPMVKATLEGRKKMTRRIIKSKHESGMFQVSTAKYEPYFPGYYHKKSIQSLDWDERTVDGGDVLCPYGKIGDIIWVRETWRIIGWSWRKGYFIIQYKDGTTKRIEDDIDDLHAERWIKQCTDDAIAAGRASDDITGEILNCQPDDFRWRPSIFMPKEACRIFLRITDIWIEQLQDISEDDAIKEGIIDRTPLGYTATGLDQSETAKDAFKYLWESINDPESWNNNPWTWVINFERIDKPE